MLTEATITAIQALKARYPDQKSLVMGALWAAQRNGGGSLTQADLSEIAGLLEMGPVEVQAAATFYSMYHVVEPVGKYHIQVCQSLSCSLLGADHLIEHLERALKIKVGEVTQDKKFSLATVECLGSCGTAPMMQINDDYYEDLTVERVDEILKRLK